VESIVVERGHDQVRGFEVRAENQETRSWAVSQGRVVWEPRLGLLRVRRIRATMLAACFAFAVPGSAKQGAKVLVLRRRQAFGDLGKA